MQQVRRTWCDDNREINELRGTLIGSELISNRDCDTINLLPLSAELHLSLSSFHAPLPLRLLSLTYAFCVYPPHPLSFYTPIFQILCVYSTVTFHVSFTFTFSMNYVFLFLSYTHTYARFIPRI